MAQPDLEVAVGIGLQLRRVDGAGGLHAAIGLVAAFLRADTEVGDAAALAADDVLVVTVDAREQVVVVGIVGANLAGLVRRQEEAGEIRIGEFQVHFQADAQQPAQVAETLGTVQRAGRRFRPQDLLPGALQRVAELFPGAAADDVGFDVLVGLHAGFPPDFVRQGMCRIVWKRLVPGAGRGFIYSD